MPRIESAFRFIIILIFISLLCISFENAAMAGFDISTFVDNMDDRNGQTVLTGSIGGMSIERGGVRFELGPGTVTLFDFGSGRTCAFVYEGVGTFIYTPPDKVEKGQLLKFENKEQLIEGFKKASFFYTVEFDTPFDTSTFKREVVGKDQWNTIRNAIEDAYDNMGVFMPNKLLGDLLAGAPGTYLHVDLDGDESGHLVFCDDPSNDDQYVLYHLKRRAGSDSYDVLSGFSTDGLLPSQRGVSPIDIQHYTIESEIGQSGKMTVKCRIEYSPARGGYPFVYFGWYNKNKIESILDSDGDTLTYVHRKDEGGFGVVLNKLPQFGETDFIDINYDCKSLVDVYGIFYVKAKTYWYPHNPIRDIAAFELVYNTPRELEIVSCGELVEYVEDGGRGICRWQVTDPVEYISFNIGVFETREYDIENLAPVKIYMSESIDHNALALELAKDGILSQADMLGTVGADVTNSLAFFSSILGPCPFDTVRATEILSLGEGQGSPGLIHLSLDSFQYEDLEGYSESLRAHEVAHQWWGHLIDNESYRDVWITEGLANYCGLWFYQSSVQSNKGVKNMLNYWRETLTSETRSSVGSKAGPMILGIRLSSSKSYDYDNIVYNKGAYVFHMIRYILHDYKTGSDDVFVAFLKSLEDKFKGKVITTELLQKHLSEFTGEDVSWFFNEWVYGTEIPKYKFSYKSSETEDGKYAVACHVKQEKVPDDFQMQVPITVLFKDDKYVHLKLWVDQPEEIIDLPKLPFKPEKIIFNTFDAVLCEVDYE